MQAYDRWMDTWEDRIKDQNIYSLLTFSILRILAMLFFSEYIL